MTMKLINGQRWVYKDDSYLFLVEVRDSKNYYHQGCIIRFIKTFSGTNWRIGDYIGMSDPKYWTLLVGQDKP